MQADILTPKKIALQSFKGDAVSLVVMECGQEFNFLAKRHYVLLGQDIEAERGAHAHKDLWQFMTCLAGHVTLLFKGEGGEFEFSLVPGEEGVLVPPGYWRDIKLDKNAVLSVLASDEYNEADYIRDYEAFIEWLNSKGKVTSVPFVALDRCHKQHKNSIDRILEMAVASNDLVLGRACQEFEESFAEYSGAKYAIGCGNGLEALTMVLSAKGIGPGDEVIVPANSFIATALAVSKVGAKPVFVDCVAETYSIDVQEIEKNITQATKAIIPVHLYGIPADMDPIMGLAEKYDLFVLEDAAQAHGATYKGRVVGSLGDAAAFSFYPTKNLGALGDGGIVTTSDAELAMKVRMQCNYGSMVKYQHKIQGGNSRLDSLQAAVLKYKLGYLPEWNNRRREIAELYQQLLGDLTSFIQLPRVPAAAEAVWHLFPVLLKKQNREQVIERLAEYNIATSIHYPYTIDKTEAYNCPVSVPCSEQAAEKLLSLPMDPYLSNQEIEYVCVKLSEILKTG